MNASPYDELAPLLIKAIPTAIASLKRKERICCVRIFYYDTHAPCAYLSLRAMSQKLREKIVAERKGESPYYLWGSGEQCYDSSVDIPDENPTLESHRQIAQYLGQIYEILCENEKEGMIEYRDMVQGVARELNEIDWSKHTVVTDDFVVAAADGSQFFCDEYEDLAHSISDDRLDLLRKRGMLGPGKEWDKAKPIE